MGSDKRRNHSVCVLSVILFTPSTEDRNGLALTVPLLLCQKGKQGEVSTLPCLSIPAEPVADVQLAVQSGAHGDFGIAAQEVGNRAALLGLLGQIIER
jgi:hypothetical protein